MFTVLFSVGLSPVSSHETSVASRVSSAEGAPANLAPFSVKRLDRAFERKLQEVFVSVQLEKVQTTADRFSDRSTDNYSKSLPSISNMDLIGIAFKCCLFWPRCQIAPLCLFLATFSRRIGKRKTSETNKSCLVENLKTFSIPYTKR